MANTVVYTSAGVAFVIVILLSLATWIRNSVDDSRLIATPTISKENAIFTSFGSARINAPPAEVFAVLMNHKDYSKWSRFSDHKWQDVNADGAPFVGSEGSFKVCIYAFFLSSI